MSLRDLRHARWLAANLYEDPAHSQTCCSRFTVQPVMFVLLFVYVFGGTIQTPGYDYADFLMPGIIVQSMSFGGFVTALGLAEDLHKGLIDRFRSLPMSRAAVLAGRTPRRRRRERVPLVIMIVVGPPRRLHFRTSVPRDRRRGRSVPGVRLRVLVGVRSPRADRPVGRSRQGERVHADLPADVRLLGVRPRRLDARRPPTVRRRQPLHVMVDAVRSLWLGTPANSDVWMAFVWCVVLLAVFAPLAVRRYRTVTAR